MNDCTSATESRFQSNLVNQFFFLILRLHSKPAINSRLTLARILTIPYLGLVLMTLAQNPRPWDVPGQQVTPPLPLQPPSRLAIGFSLVGNSHLKVAYLNEEGSRLEIDKHGSSISCRTYEPAIETENSRIYLVRAIAQKQSKVIGAIVECYLGMLWSAECFLPIGPRLNESHAAVKWYPIQGTSISFGFTNLSPSIDIDFSFGL